MPFVPARLSHVLQAPRTPFDPKRWLREVTQEFARRARHDCVA